MDRTHVCHDRRAGARAWPGFTLSVLLAVTACGGGGDEPVGSNGTGGEPPVASGGPPGAGPSSPGATPGAPAVQQATWTVVFADANGRGTPQSLNRLGQLAFTSDTAEGPRVRFFDGSTLHELQGTRATALAVNEAGQVAGRFEGDFTRAFRWDARTQQVPSVLDTSPDVSSEAASINASGVVGGTRSSRRNLPGGAIRWTPGAVPEGLANLDPAPFSSAEGLFINTAGAVAGVASAPGGGLHAVHWRAGGSAVRDVGTLGGTASTPTRLNDAGQMAGDAATADGRLHAFLWSETAGIRDLGTLGGPASVARGLNASGQVVGAADTADGASVAFLWRDGAMRPLGTLGGRASAASAINATGLVAGNAETATGVQHAFVWSEADGMIDLNTRLAGTAPGTLQSVLAMADDGTVLALAGGTLVLLRPSSGP
jgi:probable HAF family extracellular repeat protein